MMIVLSERIGFFEGLERKRAANVRRQEVDAWFDGSMRSEERRRRIEGENPTSIYTVDGLEL